MFGQGAVMNYGRLCLLMTGLLLIGTSEGQQDSPRIEIGGENPQELNGKGKGRIVCSAKGLGSNENPMLKWYDKAGNLVSSDISQSPSMFQGDNLSQLTLIFNNVKEDDAGTYTCNGTVNGQPMFAKVQVLVKMPLEISAEDCPLQQDVTEGQKGIIKCIIPNGFRATWYDTRKKPIGGGDGNNTENVRYVQQKGQLEILKANLSQDEGTFQCVVMSIDPDVPDVDIRGIRVTVKVLPKITQKPSNQNAVVGQSMRMECRGTGKPAPLFTWFKDGGGNALTGDRYDIDTANGILDIKVIQADDRGQYKCVALNNVGQDEATASVTIIIPAEIRDFRNATVNEGVAAELNCLAYGDPIPTISWYDKDNTKLDGQSDTDDANQKTRLSKLTISDVTKDSGGKYTCKADNTAAMPASKDAYLTVYYTPSFDINMKRLAWTWQGSEGRLTCIVTGEPKPTVEWSDKNGKIESRTYISREDKSEGNKVTSILKVDYDIGKSELLGEYTCIASNMMGPKNFTFELKEADKPQQPRVSLLGEIKPTSIQFDVSFTEVANGPQPKQLVVKYNSAGQQEQTITKDIYLDANQRPQNVHVLVASLAPSTSYSFTFVAYSDAGQGQEKTERQTTIAKRKPYPVQISSIQDSQYPTSYILSWGTINDGGEPLTSIVVRHREVSVRSELSPDNKYQRDNILVKAWISTTLVANQLTYTITNLKPSTFYEVDVQGINNLGSSPPPAPDTYFIFKTKPASEARGQSDVSEVYPQQPADKDSGLPVGIVILIIIIAFIVLFIVVDVTCYYTRKCGLIMCIREKMSGGSGAATVSGGKDAEKGGDEKSKETEAPRENGKENTKPLLNDKTEEGTTDDPNVKEEELKEMEPEDKEKSGVDSPTIEVADEAKPKEPPAEAETSVDAKPEVPPETPSETKTEEKAEEK